MVDGLAHSRATESILAIENTEENSLLESGPVQRPASTLQSRRTVRVALLVALIIPPVLLLLCIFILSCVSQWTRPFHISSPFKPPDIVTQCRCSVMYPFSLPFIRPAGFPNRLPWRLSRSRSYHQWEECPMWAPRSALVHKAESLPGPAVDAEDATSRADDSNVWQLPPCLLFDVWLGTSSTGYRPPVFSLQYTLFNQEEHVLSNLHALLRHADREEPFELVVVFDDCTDRTIPLTHALLHSVAYGCGVAVDTSWWNEEDLPLLEASAVNSTFREEFDSSSLCINPALVHIRTLVQPTSVWETAANNLGARAAYPSAEVLIFIQDDMLITTDSWNTILALPTRLYGDVAAVSGRCAHSHYSALPTTLPNLGASGRCGLDINKPLVLDADHRCVFSVRDTVNRGPLLIVHDVMRTLGYFDEVHFWSAR